jgi:YHS domain-containing protein
VNWIVRVILFLILLRLTWTLVLGVVRGLHEPGRPRRGREAVHLVRDPICGTFVVPARALPLSRGGETQYFCSERCRQRYLSTPQS